MKKFNHCWTVEDFDAAQKLVENEDQFQCLIALFCRRLIPAPPRGPFWSAVNPKPSKTIQVAQLSKAMGMKSGVPDMFFIQKKPLAGNDTYWVELKMEKTGVLSGSQVEVIDEMREAGATVMLVRSVSQFVQFLKMLDIPFDRDIRQEKQGQAPS